jgi:hypothetical protein
MPDQNQPKPLSELTEEELDALLLEGINSGPAEPMTRQDWDHIRAEADPAGRGGAPRAGRKLATPRSSYIM